MKKLANILGQSLLPEFNVAIQGLTLDTRLLNPGEIFVALEGTKIHGREFIPIAIEKGAAAVLVEDDADYQKLIRAKSGALIPLIAIPKLSKEIGNIAAKFYDSPAKDLILIDRKSTRLNS